MEVWDIYTRKQYSQFQEIARKEVLLDPKKRDIYFQNKKEQERMEQLVRQVERKKRILY